MRGLPILPMMQLLIVLRFYAINSFQIVHGDLRKYSQSSVSRIIKRVSILFARHLNMLTSYKEETMGLFKTAQQTKLKLKNFNSTCKTEMNLRKLLLQISPLGGNRHELNLYYFFLSYVRCKRLKAMYPY
ncbi:hypothetical protein ALC56_06904 [Trachymyrmex septentrionalis]|uniref:Nuclease HARBI1 n=1 Tax=Trachymyrmex septentrionalis TaxID=34720 RepID=A0A195FE09_9HYME|nr:hypothetical protein ALC56_06904 [Trachymyrmex septentrionalis]